MKVVQVLVLVAAVLSLSGVANAGVTTVWDTLDYTANGNYAEPWFVPPESILDHWPYHRGMWEDWGWTHDIRKHVPSDAKGILSATLVISAWDVDVNDPEGAEIDGVYANSVRLGQLEGTNGRYWRISQFELPQEVLDELWADREVYIFLDIDEIEDMVGHRVTLDYATLVVNYNVKGKGTSSHLPVHRFWSSVLGSYLFTADQDEKEQLIEEAPDTWTYQGVAYHALPTAVEPNSAPVYRFWSDVLKTHFYTISAKERDWIIERFSAQWTYEGEAFWAFPTAQPASGTIPVYRFWSDAYGRPFYTTSAEQKDELIIENSDLWLYQGIGWHVYK